MLAYRLLIALAAPVLGLAGLWRVLRGRETLADLAQRLGAGTGEPGAIWVHGASNGELAAARRLIEALVHAFPERPLLVTCNTVTARRMVRDWALPRTTARLAPLDLRWVLARFRVRWRPAALIVLENELWPNRIATAPVPVIVVAARMSETTATKWRRFAWFTRRLLPRIARLYPQDRRSGDRFLALGLPKGRLAETAQLKSGVAQTPPDPQLLARFRAVFPRESTLLAASTHPGDEALILDAFARARAANPGLRLILAPRHPARGGEIAALVAATGLPHARRTATPEPDAGVVVYLADTLGEMPLWYSLAGVTVVGGSLSDRGGHTPFEPAQFGSALIHGPDTANFADSYAALRNAGGALEVRDAESLAAALARLAPTEAQRGMAARAAQALAVLDDSAEVIERIVDDLARRIGS